jgi:hypothetical protein
MAGVLTHPRLLLSQIPLLTQVGKKGLNGNPNHTSFWIPYIALLYRLWNFPSLDKEGWRGAPGWFETLIPQVR